MKRNKRTFDHKSRSDKELSGIIVDKVKLKISALPPLEHRLRDARAVILLEHSFTQDSSMVHHVYSKFDHN